MEYKKILTFSFDDGVTQDIRFIELLDKYGLKCTFNLNSELLGKDGHLIINGKKINHNKVNKEDVRSIYKNHEVASHTLTHPLLTQLSKEEIINQVDNDRVNLSELAGYSVRGFAYPCGGVNCDERVAEVIKENTPIEYARTIMHSHSFKLQDNPYLFKPTISLLKDKEAITELSDAFIEYSGDEIALFYIWGHSYEMDVNDDWSFVEALFGKLSGREDVLYCTNSEAFDYIKSICK